MSKTSSRKKDHVDLCVNEQVSFRGKTNGLEEWYFQHNALPEINVEDIDTSTDFLGKTLSFPLLISGMTGGYAEAERINGDLAEVAEDLRLAIGAGSMRQALENDTFHESYRIMRRNAPTIPILANIGAVEVAAMEDARPAQYLVELIEADALVVHTNSLQEFLQPEGEARFRGVLEGLQLLVRDLAVSRQLDDAAFDPEAELAVVCWLEEADDVLGKPLARRRRERPAG